MKLDFEKRLEEKEAKYLAKYSKNTAYKKLYKKYNKFFIQKKASPYRIMVLLLYILLVYFRFTINGVNDTVKTYAIGFISFLGILIVLQVISYSLFYYKNKKLVEKKFSEWENVLEEDQDVQSQRLWRHFQ